MEQEYGNIYCSRKKSENEFGDDGFLYTLSYKEETPSETFHIIQYSPNNVWGFADAMDKITCYLEKHGCEAENDVDLTVYNEWSCFVISKYAEEIKLRIEQFLRFSDAGTRMGSRIVIDDISDDESINENNDGDEGINDENSDESDDESSDENSDESINDDEALDYVYCGTVFCYTEKTDDGRTIIGFMNSENHNWDDDCFASIGYQKRAKKASYNEIMFYIVSHMMSGFFDFTIIDQDDDNWRFEADAAPSKLKEFKKRILTHPWVEL